jgi:hypothetical protein
LALVCDVGDEFSTSGEVVLFAVIAVKVEVGTPENDDETNHLSPG